MERLYKVTFKYRDLNAPINEFGVLSSHFVERCKRFKSEDAIAKYVSNNKTMVHKEKVVTLLYYYVEQYVVSKEKEFSVNVHGTSGLG